MSEQEKTVRACLILLLQSAQKMISSVNQPSVTLSNVDGQLKKLIKSLRDGASNRVC